MNHPRYLLLYPPATHLPAASLRPQGAKLASGEGKGSGAGAADGVGGGMRTFREVILGDPIRCVAASVTFECLVVLLNWLTWCVCTFWEVIVGEPIR